jgi:hypothetical protein
MDDADGKEQRANDEEHPVARVDAGGDVGEPGGESDDGGHCTDETSQENLPSNGNGGVSCARFQTATHRKTTRNDVQHNYELKATA